MTKSPRRPWPILVECPLCNRLYRMITPETLCPGRGLKQHQRGIDSITSDNGRFTMVFGRGGS